MKSRMTDVGQDKKYWLVRPTVADEPTVIVIDSCSCERDACQALFRRYRLEVDKVETLQECLDLEKEESEQVILEVKEMELGYEQQIDALRLEHEARSMQVADLKDALELERKQRMEDIYKLEFLKKDYDTILQDNSDLRHQLVEASRSVHDIKIEHKSYADALTAMQHRNNALSDQLRKRESELFELEGINVMLRMRLHDAEIHIDKLQSSCASSQAQNTHEMAASRRASRVGRKSLRLAPIDHSPAMEPLPFTQNFPWNRSKT